MKSAEFTTEGIDRSVDDVKQNHPEIYDFFKKTGSWMTFDRNTRKVDSYDTDHSHMVQIVMGPTASMNNTKLNLEAAGIGYESMSNPMGAGEVLSGNIGEMYWSVKDDDRPGNITETWLFTFPRTDLEEEPIEEAGFFKGIGQKIVGGIDSASVAPLIQALDSGENKMEMYATFSQLAENKQQNLLDAIGRWLEHNEHEQLQAFYNLAMPEDDIEEIEEDDIDTGEERPEKLDLHSVFGSDAANVLRHEGIKFYEKPSYWSDLDRKAMDQNTLKTAEFALEEEGIQLNEYPAWQIFPINPDNSAAYVKGPLQTVENMPDEKVFVVYDLPYSDERRGVTEPQIGTFLVDTQGATSYIRSWIMIK